MRSRRSESAPLSQRHCNKWYLWILTGHWKYGERTTNFSQNANVVFPPGHFHSRTTDSITIFKMYTAVAQITVSGFGFSCQSCSGAYFTNAMMQQGRQLCDNEYGFCSGASKCPLKYTDVQSDGRVSCSYRCVCPPPTTNEQDPCGKITFVFGEGIRKRHDDTFTINRIIA